MIFVSHHNNIIREKVRTGVVNEIVRIRLPGPESPVTEKSYPNLTRCLPRSTLGPLQIDKGNPSPVSTGLFTETIF